MSHVPCARAEAEIGEVGVDELELDAELSRQAVRRLDVEADHVTGAIREREGQTVGHIANPQVAALTDPGKLRHIPGFRLARLESCVSHDDRILLDQLHLADHRVVTCNDAPARLRTDRAGRPSGPASTPPTIRHIAAGAAR